MDDRLVVKELLIESMHPIPVLVKVFCQQASDEMNDSELNLIRSTLEFMHARGVFREQQVSALIRTNRREDDCARGDAEDVAWIELK